MEPKATIEGFGNIGDERTCPHCNGWKEPDEDICDDCAGDFEEPDEELDDEPGEACEVCGATEDTGRVYGRFICDDCDDED